MACALGALVAPRAHATVTYTASGPLTSYPGAPSNSIVVDDFNGTMAPGATITAYSLPPMTNCDPGSVGCNAQYVTPAQDPGVPAGTPANQLSLAVSPGNGVGFTVIDFSTLGLDSVSFYWGSIDNWNVVQLLTPDGNLVESGGVQEPGSNVSGTSLITSTCATDPTGPGVTCDSGYYNHAGSQLVTFSWDPATDDVGEIQFIDTTYPAFEVGEVTGTVAAVPEPASWALFALGAGLTLLGARKFKLNQPA